MFSRRRNAFCIHKLSRVRVMLCALLEHNNKRLLLDVLEIYSKMLLRGKEHENERTDLLWYIKTKDASTLDLVNEGACKRLFFSIWIERHNLPVHLGVLLQGR